MDPALALSLVTVVIGLVVAVLSLRIGSAPGWLRYRSLAVVGFSAAAYATLDMFWELDVSSTTRRVVLHLLGFVAGVHAASWLSYVGKHLGSTNPRLERWLIGGSVLLGVLWLVPGLMFREVTAHLSVPWLGVQYRFPELRWTGSLALALQISLFVGPMVRYVRAARQRLPGARLHALALSAIFLAAINDTLASSGIIHSPLLVAFGFVMAVGALGWDLTHGFVGNARELERLSQSLEELVGERTRALVSAEATLLRTEKMAALGQLSAGVAHEINNPAAAIQANLGYLRDALAERTIPGDAVQCVDESLEGVTRITKIVAQLLDSGRAAARARRDGGITLVLRAVQQAFASSRARIGAHVTTSFDVPPDLTVRADESSLVQVLVNLLVNAAQAISVDRDAGRVVVRASIEGNRVAIDVVDNGAGMSEATKRRLFEPFFTTKRQGEGTGLGLSVSLGLLRAMGGDLLVSSNSGGTSMKIVLDRSEDLLAIPLQTIREPAKRHRLLVVDDDRVLARALARSLDRAFEVTLASGVAEARELLAAQIFDVVLSDMQMPDGGGRRVYEELLARSPELARRVILFSGGPASETDSVFFDANRIELLQKPLAMGKLVEAANRLCGQAGTSAQA